MSSIQPLSQLPVAAPAIALDADFNVRWAAWLARGRAHEETVRRRLVMYGGAIAVATAILYTFASSWLPR